jgi:hypothetical protein
VMLPLYPQMTDEEVTFVSGCLRDACSVRIATAERR